MIGCWRLYEHCEAGVQMIARGVEMEENLGRSILEGFSALKGAESHKQEEMEMEMTKMSLSARSPRGAK
jgi:hypothetical protein